AFVNVVVALGSSVSTALFGSVIAVRLTQVDTSVVPLVGRFAALNYIFSIGVALAILCLVWFWTFSPLLASLYLVYTVSSLLRWFVRSCGYAHQRLLTVAGSDLAYALVAISGVAIVLLAHNVAIFTIVSAT